MDVIVSTQRTARRSISKGAIVTSDDNAQPDNKEPEKDEIHPGWAVVLEFIASLFSFWH